MSTSSYLNSVVKYYVFTGHTVYCLWLVCSKNNHNVIIQYLMYLMRAKV
jgi:hypothetical protein